MWAHLQHTRNGSDSGQDSGENTWSSNLVAQVEDEHSIRPLDLYASAAPLTRAISRSSSHFQKLTKALRAVTHFTYESLTNNYITDIIENNTTEHITQVAESFRSQNRLMRQRSASATDLDTNFCLGYCYLRLTNLQYTGMPFWLDARMAVLTTYEPNIDVRATWTLTPATKTLPWLT